MPTTTTVPTSTLATLAIACNYGLDRGEMPTFTADDAITAIRDGTIIERLATGLNADTIMSAVTPHAAAITALLQSYENGYGCDVSDHTRAEHRGLCVVLGMAVELMRGRAITLAA